MASSSTSTRKGKGKGRQKIKMEKIKNESNLQVTFSKRRNGVFKKAFELSVLTEAEVAIIVFSPSGKVYSFGYPSVEIVANKFLTGNPQPMTYTQQLQQILHEDDVAKMIAELETIKDKMEVEKKRGEDLDQMLAQRRNQYWGASHVDGHNLPQLKQSFVALKNLKADLEREINARALIGYQNYGAPFGGGNIYRDGEMPLLLEGSTYDGNEGKNSLPTHMRRNVYEDGEGSARHKVGASGGGGGFYGNVDDWLFNDGPSSSHVRGFTNMYGASSSKVDDNGGGSIIRDPKFDGLMPSHGFNGGF